MLLSRLCELLILGDGLVARLRKFSVEPIVDPWRKGFALCSRLVEALSGKPNPPVCFSSLLRLCLCPGRCSLCPPMEALCGRPLLLASGCDGWLLLKLGVSCRNSQSQFLRRSLTAISTSHYTYLGILIHPRRYLTAWGGRWCPWP